MSSEPFYSPTHTVPPRQRRPSELLWTMTNGPQTSHAELRLTGVGLLCELQIFVNGELRHGQLHANREFALMEAGIRRETLRVKGWAAG